VNNSSLPGNVYTGHVMRRSRIVSWLIVGDIKWNNAGTYTCSTYGNDLITFANAKLYINGKNIVGGEVLCLLTYYLIFIVV